MLNYGPATGWEIPRPRRGVLWFIAGFAALTISWVGLVIVKAMVGVLS